MARKPSPEKRTLALVARTRNNGARQVATSLAVLDQRTLTGSPAGVFVRPISTSISGAARVALQAAKPARGPRTTARTMLSHPSANLDIIIIAPAQLS